MKPRALLASAVDAAFFAAVCAAFGLAVALAWDAAAHGPHSLLRSRTSPPPAVSTRASAFRGAGWGEAAGDSSCPAPAPQETDPTMRTPIDLLIDEDFLAALAAVESGGDDSAVNLSSGATGRYQITAVCLIDANRILGTDFALVEMHDPAKARRVVRAYLGHYGARLRHPTHEALARIWNGGPRGHLRDATRGYAERFHRAYLEARHA